MRWGLKTAQNTCYRCLRVYEASFEECYLTKDKLPVVNVAQH